MSKKSGKIVRLEADIQLLDAGITKRDKIITEQAAKLSHLVHVELELRNELAKTRTELEAKRHEFNQEFMLRRREGYESAQQIEAARNAFEDLFEASTEVIRMLLGRCRAQVMLGHALNTCEQQTQPPQGTSVLKAE